MAHKIFCTIFILYLFGGTSEQATFGYIKVPKCKPYGYHCRSSTTYSECRKFRDVYYLFDDVYNCPGGTYCDDNQYYICQKEKPKIETTTRLTTTEESKDFSLTGNADAVDSTEEDNEHTTNVMNEKDYSVKTSNENEYSTYQWDEVQYPTDEDNKMEYNENQSDEYEYSTEEEISLEETTKTSIVQEESFSQSTVQEEPTSKSTAEKTENTIKWICIPIKTNEITDSLYSEIVNSTKGLISNLGPTSSTYSIVNTDSNEKNISNVEEMGDNTTVLDTEVYTTVPQEEKYSTVLEEEYYSSVQEEKYSSKQNEESYSVTEDMESYSTLQEFFTTAASTTTQLPIYKSAPKCDGLEYYLAECPKYWKCERWWWTFKAKLISCPSGRKFDLKRRTCLLGSCPY